MIAALSNGIEQSNDVNWRRPDGECSDPTSPLRMAISLSPVCPTPVDAAILGAVKKPVKHGSKGITWQPNLGRVMQNHA
jgi:hypothetical protein